MCVVSTDRAPLVVAATNLNCPPGIVFSRGPPPPNPRGLAGSSLHNHHLTSIINNNTHTTTTRHRIPMQPQGPTHTHTHSRVPTVRTISTRHARQQTPASVSSTNSPNITGGAPPCKHATHDPHSEPARPNATRQIHSGNNKHATRPPANTGLKRRPLKTTRTRRTHADETRSIALWMSAVRGGVPLCVGEEYVHMDIL